MSLEEYYHKLNNLLDYISQVHIDLNSKQEIIHFLHQLEQINQTALEELEKTHHVHFIQLGKRLHLLNQDEVKLLRSAKTESQKLEQLNRIKTNIEGELFSVVKYLEKAK